MRHTSTRGRCQSQELPQNVSNCRCLKLTDGELLRLFFMFQCLANVLYCPHWQLKVLLCRSVSTNLLNACVNTDKIRGKYVTKALFLSSCVIKIKRKKDLSSVVCSRCVTVSLVQVQWDAKLNVPCDTSSSSQVRSRNVSYWHYLQMVPLKDV